MLQGKELDEMGEERDLLMTFGKQATPAKRGSGREGEALWGGGGGMVPTPKRKMDDSGQASEEGGGNGRETVTKRMRRMSHCEIDSGDFESIDGMGVTPRRDFGDCGLMDGMGVTPKRDELQLNPAADEQADVAGGVVDARDGDVDGSDV